jgi:hypothetical protein
VSFHHTLRIPASRSFNTPRIRASGSSERHSFARRPGAQKTHVHRRHGRAPSSRFTIGSVRRFWPAGRAFVAPIAHPGFGVAPPEQIPARLGAPAALVADAGTTASPNFAATPGRRQEVLSFARRPTARVRA